ncbi:maleylacetoacetate isomerase [uncultured Enterovirga sp.]|uniref:maleylacetoacetate isomerase n=1 Tax=uncultured Enterovirga sp. TaxID=2026352 RepID=UPI0035CC9593
MQLWGFWRSLATFRVRIALNLKGISFEETSIDLIAGVQRSESYRAVNPQMVLPALVDGEGPVLFQSLAILEYLEETRPEPPLLPTDARGRARVRGLAAIVAADSHPLIVPRVREYLDAELGIAEEARARWCRHWIEAGLTAIESHLATEPETGRYCHGDTATIADICLVSLTVGANLFGARPENLPHVTRIAESCLAEAAFADAHPLRQAGAPPQA